MVSGNDLQWNRSAIAKRSRKIVADGRWMRAMIGQAKSWANQHVNLSTQRIGELSLGLRHETLAQQGPSQVFDGQLLAAAAGLVCVATRRMMGVDLFDTQLHAGFIISLGGVAEMQTGEGKTLAGVLPAYLHSLSGKGVHVVTPNAYLAERDQSELAPIFGCLGITTGLVGDQLDGDQSRAAYLADITYGASQTFGFDFLRDRLSHDSANKAQPGDVFLSRLRGLSEPTIRQRSRVAAIVDEIDDVLLDDAVSPLILSGVLGEVAEDADAYRAAKETACGLQKIIHFMLPTTSDIALTQVGIEKIYADQPRHLLDQLQRPWHEYVQASLRAEYCYSRDVHYVVQSDHANQEQRVRIIDPSTGRVFADRSWSGGLQQAVEAKEGLQIRPETNALASTTKQNYFRGYSFLAGMTGTADRCEAELAAVYGLPVVAVPTRLASRRDVLPTTVTSGVDDKRDAVTAEAIAVARMGRAVLVGTLSVAESHEIAKRLEASGQPFQLLNGIQDAEEANVISRAGEAGAITVATNLAGRGTDIRLPSDVVQRGGLHVILTQSHSYSRVDRQLIGRGARCGDPGTARRYIAADDPLILEHAPWVSRAILREIHDAKSITTGRFDGAVQSVQHTQQSLAMAERMRTLEADREDQRLAPKQHSDLDTCWAM